MNDYFDFSNYELDLIKSGLWIMMTEKAKNSMEATEIKAEQNHEELSLKLFELCLKIKSLNDNHINLSPYELSLIKSGLMFLADFTYQQSLEDTDETQYYEDFDLQFVEIWKNIHNTESGQRH